MTWSSSLSSTFPSDIQNRLQSQQQLMCHRLCAVLLKEILSLSFCSQNSQKKLITELVKALTVLTPKDQNQWLRDESIGQIVLKVLVTVSQQYSLDRITQKTLNGFVKSCQEIKYETNATKNDR
jgi:hypothetical protein